MQITPYQQSIFALQNPWQQDGTPFDPSLYKRKQLPELLAGLSNDKILALIGSRQVGKTSLMRLMIANLIQAQNINPKQISYFNLDDLAMRGLFETTTNILDFLGFTETRANTTKQYLFIDEVERLENPGLTLKAIQDLGLPLKIIVSGSAQLEIKAKLKENLVGRMRQFVISPMGFEEQDAVNSSKYKTLDLAMLFGGYPEVVSCQDFSEKEKLLGDIYESYVQKDIVNFLRVPDVNAFNSLLVLIAAQTGGMLNVDTLSAQLSITRDRTEYYLQILEDTFIIKRVYPFHKNYNKEITKRPKVYFLDLGIRNFILDRYKPGYFDNLLRVTLNAEPLFENFVFTELFRETHHSAAAVKYWRTTNQTEIDFILERGTSLDAIETKLKARGRFKAFVSFKERYPEANTYLVTRDNFKAGSKNWPLVR